MPRVFAGAINGARCRAYVEEMLAPTLRPGDIVLLGNLSSSKAALPRTAERARDGLWRAIGQTLDRYQPHGCRNFFTDASYAIRSETG